MTQNPQRFSGRELGLLLSQVRDELGDDATIIEANRLREGGIGGFFSKERFEVVAAPPDEPNTATAAGANPLHHLDQLLDRAERVSVDERRSTLGAGAGAGAGADADAAAPGAATVLSGAGPSPSELTDTRFDEILRSTLSDLAAPIAPLAPAAAPPPPPPPPPPPASPRPQTPAAAVADRFTALPTSTPPPPPPPSAPARREGRPQRDLRSLPGGAFWANLVRFEALIDEVPLTSDVTTIVGPLDDAVAVARLLARVAGIDLGDVVVFTEQRSVDGMPPWQVVDRRDDVVDRVRYWRANGRRAVVVVDLEPGDRGLDRTARTVEAAGGDLTRLVVPTLDDPAGLATTLRGLGPVVAIDVSRPPRPEALVEAVEQGVRIGTVCGRPLTAMLLAGLAAAVHHG